MSEKPPRDRWIVIPRWEGEDGFQHYKDRDPIWIKNYRRLLHDDAYLALSFVQRGILHGIWLEYAASNRQLRDSTLTLSRRLGQRVTRTSLEALNHAGFITFVASKPLAPRYQPASPHARRGETEEETETETETEPRTSPVTENPALPPKKARPHTNGTIDTRDPLAVFLAGTIEELERKEEPNR